MLDVSRETSTGLSIHSFYHVICSGDKKLYWFLKPSLLILCTTDNLPALLASLPDLVGLLLLSERIIKAFTIDNSFVCQARTTPGWVERMPLYPTSVDDLIEALFSICLKNC